MARHQVALGVVGVAVLLGGASYVVTDLIVGGDRQVAEDPGALPVVPSIPVASPSAPRPARSSPAPKTVPERVAAARSAAAKAHDQIRRPLPPQNGNAVVTADEMTVTDSGTLKKDHATLRVVSARRDLTGQHELSWVADQGRAVGDAVCTQNFHFSAGAPAMTKPTLLLCWRISAAKSVYTVAVDLAGHPSEAASVAAIDQRWTQLG